MSSFPAARALGWASLAIGITEIVAARWLEEQMGIDDHEDLIRGFGVRELATGATILAQPGLNKTVAVGMWSRVAGDALDLAALGAAGEKTRRPSGLATITAMVLTITGLDILVASRVQMELQRAATVSKKARQRVTPTNALPKGIVRNSESAKQAPSMA